MNAFGHSLGHNTKILLYVLLVICVSLFIILLTHKTVPTLTTQKVSSTNAAAAFAAGLQAKQNVNYDLAVKEFTTVLNLTPNDTSALRELALAQYQLGHYDDAIATYQKLALQSGYVAFAWNGMGNVFRDKKDVPQAEAAYREAIKQDPTFAVAYNNLAILLLDNGDKTGGVLVMRDGLSHNPSSADLKASAITFGIK